MMARLKKPRCDEWAIYCGEMAAKCFRPALNVFFCLNNFSKTFSDKASTRKYDEKTDDCHQKNLLFLQQEKGCVTCTTEWVTCAVEYGMLPVLQSGLPVLWNRVCYLYYRIGYCAVE
ncbi:hypothetical protein ACOMHN_055136 [Nucella lapillus]